MATSLAVDPGDGAIIFGLVGGDRYLFLRAVTDALKLDRTAFTIRRSSQVYPLFVAIPLFYFHFSKRDLLALPTLPVIPRFVIGESFRPSLIGTMGGDVCLDV